MTSRPSRFVCLALLLLGASHQAHAAVLTLYEPAIGSTYVVLDIEATNNNDGSIYNSADLNLTSQLATDLWALDSNQSFYSTMQDMIADWDMNIRASPTGEVYEKWGATANSDGSFSIAPNGAGPDTWYSTSEDPSQDMQFYTINIPKSQLEFDGIAGYDPATDASIVLSEEGNTIPDAFVGYEGTGGNVIEYSTSGQYFQVAVPESSAYPSILGFAALGWAGFLRRWRPALRAVT